MDAPASATLPSARKQFLKCVDCGRQMLPQSLSPEEPWAAAASLHVAGRVDDGALCFGCANQRRQRLGLPVRTAPAAPRSPAPAFEATLKKVCINRQPYSWEVGSLASLLTRWRDECAAQPLRNRDIKSLLVAVNDTLVPARRFDTMPVRDGDAITILAGAITGG